MIAVEFQHEKSCSEKGWRCKWPVTHWSASARPGPADKPSNTAKATIREAKFVS
jgi:hypothetical protein